jgi:membrane protein
MPANNLPPLIRIKGQLKSYFALFFRVIRGAFLTFRLAKGAEAASSISYYTLFSMFPLVLSFVAIGSFFVDQATVENELISLLPNIIPVSQEFIITNVQQVFKLRGTVSSLALLGLIWSSTAVFTTIIRNINAAWPAAAPHSFIRMRLWSLAIIAAMALVLIISSFSLTFKNLLINLGFTINDLMVNKFLSSFFYTKIFPVLIRVLVFFALYYWVPQIKVNKMGALTGAVVATLLWQVITNIFSNYLSSGLAKYEIVYGSLGKMIALLAWIYFSSWIILFGAHLTSSIDRHT